MLAHVLVLERTVRVHEEHSASVGALVVANGKPNRRLRVRQSSKVRAWKGESWRSRISGV